MPFSLRVKCTYLRPVPYVPSVLRTVDEYN